MSSENKMRTTLFSTSSIFYFRSRRQNRFYGRKMRTDQDKYKRMECRRVIIIVA